MPMQIAYNWTHATDRAGARRLVAAMREAALKLPFVSVGEIMEDEWGSGQLRDADKRDRPKMTEAEFESTMRRWPGRWFIQNEDDFSANGHLIEPVWTCYFTAQLNGCDPVTAGLAEHVKTIDIERDFGVSEASTNLDGRMAWQCKCETLNACLPQLGGWDNFFKQHTTVLQFIEAVEGLGLKVDAWDQGGYRESRDADLLREELDRSAAITAHTIGHLKDRIGDDPDLARDLPMLTHPQFEHLEARGAAIIAQGPHPEVRRQLEGHDDGEDWKRGPSPEADEVV